MTGTADGSACTSIVADVEVTTGRTTSSMDTSRAPVAGSSATDKVVAAGSPCQVGTAAPADDWHII